MWTATLYPVEITDGQNFGERQVYGKKIDATDIVRKGAVPVPDATKKLVVLFDKYSPRNDSDPNSLK